MNDARTADGAAMIVLERVDKSYRKGKLRVPALRGASLHIASGEFVALMGPSGSGKSTLLNLVGGLDRPDAGEVRVGGALIGAMGDRARTVWRGRHVGLVFQRHHLIPVLTAAKNVELPLLLRRMSGKERRDRVANVLEMVGLSNRVQHLPSELSGGQEQRVAIARALVTDPQLLLCDEPTGNLDEATGAEILAVLSALNRNFGKTILMVTHSTEAATVASRVLQLHDGVIGPARDPS